MAKFIVSSSPHISTTFTTRRMMLDVIIALVPATIASVLLYGFYPLCMMVLCVGTCVFAEWLFNLITKKYQSVGDLSAVVTGMILSLNLPPVVPFYVPMVGGFFAIVVVKMLFGGIGKNFANPAITARIFLMLCWTTVMTSFVQPIDLSNGMNLFSFFDRAVDIDISAITSATPLAGVKSSIAAGTNPAQGLSALDMFLGRIGGSAGEVSTIALLIGGIYLLIRKVIDWRIPALYIGSTVVFTAIFFSGSEYVGQYVWTYLLSGGLMFGAFFMATDYATSPKTCLAVVIYGVGLGFLTVVFRKFGTMNEGVSFAILLMNVLTPLLEKITPRAFGAPKKNNLAKLMKHKRKDVALEGGAKMTDEKMLREDEVMQNENIVADENAETIAKESVEKTENAVDTSVETDDKKGKKDKKEKRKMSEVAKCSLVLVIIAVVAGLLLGIVNWATYVDPDNTIMEKCKAYSWGDGKTVTDVVKDEQLASYDYDKNNYVVSCFVAKSGEEILGYCYYTVGGGAKDGSLSSLVFIGADGIIEDVQVYEQGETAGYFDRVEKANKQKYVGINCKTIERLELVKSGNASLDGQIDAVSQATYTSTGYHNSIATAVYAFRTYYDALQQGGAQ